MPQQQGFARLVDGIEKLAALSLAGMTALTFVAVVLRYVFNVVIPDAFDIARLLLGISIFWGIAGANYRDEHIGMDLVWSLAGPRAKHWIDVGSGLLTLVAFYLFWAMLSFKVGDTFRTGETTFDLHLKLWAFYAAAWLGIAAGCVLLAVRIWRLLLNQPGTGGEPQNALHLE